MWHGGFLVVAACNAGDLHLIPGREDPLEKEMATQSSILAWEVLWTEEPGGATVLRVEMSYNTTAPTPGHICQA